MNDTTLTKEEKQYKRLTEEPVARLVLELGLPTTISMLDRRNEPKLLSCEDIEDIMLDVCNKI